MEKKEYTVTELEVKTLTPDEILSEAFDSDIARRMKEVIATESPIKESLLIKRVLSSLSIYKNGSRISAHLSPILSSLNFPSTIDRDGERVYHTGVDENYFRPTPDPSVRYSYQIPSSEAASAILYILEKGNKNSYTKSELYRLFYLRWNTLKVERGF